MTEEAEETNVTPFKLDVEGESLTQDELIAKYIQINADNLELKRDNRKAVKRYRREKFLKPYQAELIQMQHYLEDTNRKMIIIFEGRDASGKGGTIRRVTRYMNEKHYRIVALGKPTEEQRTQWFLSLIHI